MAIDIQSLFNPGSLQDMAETEDERKKRAQLTGTMNLGGQSGTFTGTFDPSLFQQTNTSAPVGYQPPPNYGMSAPPEQQTLPVVPAPAPAPPVGTNPISGEYTAPPQPPADLPTYNQPYQIPPAVTQDDRSRMLPPGPVAPEMLSPAPIDYAAELNMPGMIGISNGQPGSFTPIKRSEEARNNYFESVVNAAGGYQNWKTQNPGQDIFSIMRQFDQFTPEQQYGYLGGSPFGQIGQGSQDLNLQMMNQKP